MIPGIARETQSETWGGTRLHILPSSKQFTTTGWEQLQEQARAGAHVYVSIFGGNHAEQRGPWHPNLDKILRITMTTRYGLNDVQENDSVEWTLEEPLGSYPAGTTWNFPVGGSSHLRAHFPIDPEAVEVIATDREGRPALIRRKTGNGALYLGPDPLEAMSAYTPETNPNDLGHLYRALSEEAGVARVFPLAPLGVAVDAIQSEESEHLIALNLTPEHLDLTPEIELRPFGAQIFTKKII